MHSIWTHFELKNLRRADRRRQQTTCKNKNARKREKKAPMANYPFQKSQPGMPFNYELIN
jgi:hypothetical protein